MMNLDHVRLQEVERWELEGKEEQEVLYLIKVLIVKKQKRF